MPGRSLSFDPRARSKSLCARAEVAIVKGDLELAQRLLTQADVDDPRNPYPEEQLRRLDGEIARFEALKSGATPRGRKFDFLYAPTLRGLSTELSSLLPLHPDVFVVSKQELDRAIEKRNESGLLAKYQEQVLNGSEHLKTGLVQHNFIANQLAGQEVAERLASVTTRMLFIHGVRDPVQLVISSFNLELIARYCGTYLFWPADPKTPFCSAVYVLTDWPKRKRVQTLHRLETHWRRGPSYYRHMRAIWRDSGLTAKLFSGPLSRSSLDAARIGRLLDECLSRPRHFAVGQTYAQHFESWVPIDLERSSAVRLPVLGRVFEAIGVDSQFTHEAFRVSENTQIHHLMVQNWIAVEAFGHTVQLGLGLAGRTMYSNTYPFAEMLSFGPDDRFTRFGLGSHPLCVSIDRDQWRSLPRDIRIRLVESEELLKFRDSVLIPAWLESCAKWKSRMAGYLMRELEPATLTRLRARIGTDLEKFLKRHPKFEHHWRSTDALLGP